MWMRLITVGLMSAAVLPGLTIAEGGKPVANVIDHDFGTKVLMVVTQSTGGKGSDVAGHYVEKAKVRRLGDRYFLVGRIPDFGQGYEHIKGTILWTPLSEIVQITECDSLDQVNKIYADSEKYKKAKKSKKSQ